MKNTSMSKIINKVHQRIEDGNITKGQLKKAFNLLSMILAQDPSAQATILMNGIKFEKEWNKNMATVFCNNPNLGE